MLHAVVIGIDSYADERIPALISAKADAEAISEHLNDGIVPAERSVTTLTDQDATRANIIDAIGEVLPLQQAKEDLVVIYFAGHGCPEQQDAADRVNRYLIPFDANYEKIFSTGLGLETDLKSALERQFSARVLLILDTCFSGRAGGRGFFGPTLKHRVSQFRTPLSLRGFALGYGKVIFAACGDDEVAQERNDHGIFTRNLIEVLTTRREPTIGIGHLYDSVFTKVVHETEQMQHPVLKGHLMGMRFPCFRRP